jgi:LacI family transcriptional regulator
MARRQIPFINTYAFEPDRPYSCVGFDNAVAGEKVASHLVQLGHKKISECPKILRYSRYIYLR